MKTSWPSRRLDHQLAARNPVSEAELAGSEASPEARAMLARIVAAELPTASRAPASRPRPLAVLAAAAVVLAVVVGLVVSVPGSHGGAPSATARSSRGSGPLSPPAAQLVDFSTQDGKVVARITDPTAAAAQLDAVFRAHGFDIALQVLPVSPSMVGSIVEMSLSQGSGDIAPIFAGTCLGGGDQCTVGLVFPAGWHGQASVAVGRAARPGEAYASASSSFGPGEALHCSGVLNAPVPAAAALLQAKGLQVDWRLSQTSGGVPFARSPGAAAGTTTTTPPSDWEALSGDYVTGGVPLSSTRVMIEVSAQPLPGSSSFVAAADQGC